MTRVAALKLASAIIVNCARCCTPMMGSEADIETTTRESLKALTDALLEAFPE